MNFNTYDDAIKFVNEQENTLKSIYTEIEDIALYNQKKVLDAFKNNNVALTDFAGSTGYGYDDRGKNKLGKIVAEIFKTEDAIVSPLFTCGTHALSCTLFGLLRPNDVMLSISGAPYDTLVEVINGDDIGSLKELGVKYEQVELLNGKFNYEEIGKKIIELSPKMVYIQRSRGYSGREPFSIEEIKNVIDLVRSINSSCIVMVDNCYGELVEKQEPTEVGADIVAGSLIKNLGGGIAPTGGYVAGKEKYVQMVARHLTAPTLGLEVGSYKSGYTEFFEGLFFAPHVVSGVLKGMLLSSKVLTELGCKTNPQPNKVPKDIICMIDFNDEKKMISFCESIQASSPVDSFVRPEPSDMPGYLHKVIMAAGTFVQGASIELSCDGPVVAPYRVYMQGGLTYEHIKIAIAEAIKKI